MPTGHWFDFWTGRRLPSAASSASAAIITEPPTIHQVIETLPVYVRGGSIIPLQPLVQNTDELPNGPLELRVYPGASCAGSIYLDDGRTFRYKSGEFLRQAFTCASESNSISVKFGERQGTYAPWWKSVEVVIYEWPSAKADVSLPNGAKPLKTSYDASARALHVVIPDVTTGEVRVSGKRGR
jgi:alpha-glucosidase